MDRNIRCGRSGAHRHNEIDQQYLARIVQDCDQYKHSNRDGKGQLIRDVIAWLSDSGVQFVEKDPNNIGEWIPVTDEKRIYNKVGQAFRDRLRLLAINSAEDEDGLDEEEAVVGEEEAVNVVVVNMEELVDAVDGDRPDSDFESIGTIGLLEILFEPQTWWT